MGWNETHVWVLVVGIGCGGTPVQGMDEGNDEGEASNGNGNGDSQSDTSTTTETTTTIGGSAGPATASTEPATSETATTGTTATATTLPPDTDGTTDGTGNPVGSTGGGSTTGPLTCADLNPLDGPPLTCSTGSQFGADIMFENECTASIDVYWVNFQCEEVHYQNISAGNTWGIETGFAHPWRIRDDSGKLLREILTPTDGTTYTVPF